MDKALTVNSLVQKGIIPSNLMGSFINAPEAALRALDTLPPQGVPKTLAEVVAFVPKQFRGAVEAGLKTLAAQQAEELKLKDGLVAGLKANAKCKLQEDDLKVLSVSALKNLEASLREVSYQAAAGAAVVVKANSDGSGVPAMPKIEDLIKANTK